MQFSWFLKTLIHFSRLKQFCSALKNISRRKFRNYSQWKWDFSTVYFMNCWLLRKWQWWKVVNFSFHHFYVLSWIFLCFSSQKFACTNSLVAQFNKITLRCFPEKPKKKDRKINKFSVWIDIVKLKFTENLCYKEFIEWFGGSITS